MGQVYREIALIWTSIDPCLKLHVHFPCPVNLDRGGTQNGPLKAKFTDGGTSL